MRCSDRIWRWSVVVGLAAVALVGLRGLAGEAVAEAARSMLAAPTSVAAVDFGSVLELLDEKRERERELEMLGGDWIERIERLRSQLGVVTEELQVLQRGTDVFRARQEEAIRLEAQLRIESEIAERRVAQMRMQLQLGLYNKIVTAVGRFAVREGYDIVLTNDANEEIPADAAERMAPEQFMAMLASRRLVYASGAIDITDEVALMMNNEYQAP